MLLSTALLVGFLGSFHCLGMCAPITWAIPDKASNRKKWLANKLIYNFGRVVTYSFLGAVVGLIGEMFAFAGFQQWLSIFAGSTLIIGVILFGGNIPKIRLFKPLSNFMNWVKSKMSKLITAKGWKSNISLGMVNGLLPCGLVYAALIGAISMGDFLGGAAYMSLFGLGTFPMMIGAAIIGRATGQTFKSRISSFAPKFIVVLGILFILRGLNFGIPYISPKLSDNNEIMNCALQTNQEAIITFLEGN